MKAITFAVIFAATLFGHAIFGQKVGDHVRILAPGAPWDVVFEGLALDIKQVATKADGAYVLFHPSKTEVNLSMYIEPAAKCKSSDDCRDFVLNAGNPAWGKFEGLNKANFGKFSYFEFYRPEVIGRPLQMQDLYAQHVDKGYWVDLHLSKVLYKKEQKKLFEDVMTAVKFVPKDTGNEKTDEIKKFALQWLAVWDEQNCRASYAGLTSYSKEKVKESLWVEYCTSAHMGLGKLKSRELLAVVTTSSLPQLPGTAGASLRYQSKFANADTIEYVSLTQEKNGTWTVSNYITLR